MTAEPPHVSVCVCTFKRPALLTRTLEHVGKQETGGLFGFSVIVVDNDSSGSARLVVSEFAKRFQVPTTYCVEPQQNIALARNKALQSSRGDFVAFIDDDEFACATWLQTLYKACLHYKVDGVLGPVVPYFEQEPPAWVIKGRFYDRPRHETGFIIDWTEGRTGNVLFQRTIFGDRVEVFKPEFGSGGEDRDLFKRMMQAGRKFVWCDEAIVHEVVPPVRWKRSFMLRRALLRGKMAMKDPSTRLSRVVQSVLALGVYSFALPFLLLLGQHNFMKYMVKVCDHAGRIMTFLGFNVVRTAYVTE